MNVRLREDDSACINFEWTDEDPDGESVFATLGEAKREAIQRAIPERDAWASLIRDIRSRTKWDVMGGA